jgi:hypothetical protein
MKKINIIILAISMIFMRISVCIADLSNGLVAYYPFNGNANDESGMNNHGLVSGSILTEDILKNPNSAYYFDGVDDFIKIEDSKNLRPKNVTLSGWFNFSQTPSGIVTLIEKAYGEWITDSYVIWYDSGKLGTHIADSAGDGPFLTYTFNPILGKWYHIAMTLNDDTDQQVLFVDGQAVDSEIVTKTIEYDSHPVIIGGDNERGGLNFLFPGKIDNVYIFNRTLSESEISELYVSEICFIKDTDGDGIIDKWDNCPDTPENSWIDKYGCQATGLYTEEQMNQMIEAILTWGDIDGDKKITLTEAIHALRVTSGVIEPDIK